MKIHGFCKAEICGPGYSEPLGDVLNENKPVIKLDFDDGTILYITTNLAEMIGGLGRGARVRFEKEKLKK